MNRPFLSVILICSTIFISLNSFSPKENNGLIRDVLNHTNKFRSSKGLPELIIMDELNAIAQRHSENMADGKVGFGHGGFAKRNEMAKKKINPFNSFAENVAYGVTTGKEVVTMWKNSSGHRRNMLGRYKYIGIGIAKDDQGRIYFTQVFVG